MRREEEGKGEGKRDRRRGEDWKRPEKVGETGREKMRRDGSRGEGGREGEGKKERVGKEERGIK